jgi:trk system potassium uptake protein
MSKIKTVHFSPGRILLLSIIFVIGIGTFLLTLPQARQIEMSLIDIFFTSTSATCVTGLHVVKMSSFTLFGKSIILALIQIGGLGLMTLSFFFASIFLNLGIATRFMAGKILEFEVWSKVKYFLLLIISITLTCEILGAIYLYFQFKGCSGGEEPIFSAIFHSVSAFCNAGLSLYDNSLISYAQKPLMLAGFAVLMFAGSIGFVVWYDLLKILKSFINKLRGVYKFFSLSLHTKIVLISTITITIFGGIAIWLLERHNAFSGISYLTTVPNALFCSLSARSVGFQTINYASANLSTLFFLIPLMFIGAAPGSTGSGIKITTFVIFIATVFSIMRGRSSVELGGRSIPHDQIYKVLAIIALATFWIFASTFVLLIVESDFTFMQILFESISAFGTCGFSTGITPQLTKIGKLILITTMLVGRIGSLTLVLAIRKRTKKIQTYQYPEERIMIG